MPTDIRQQLFIASYKIWVEKRGHIFKTARYLAKRSIIIKPPCAFRNSVFYAYKALSPDLNRHVCVLPHLDGTSCNKNYWYENHGIAGHIALKGSYLRDVAAADHNRRIIGKPRTSITFICESAISVSALIEIQYVSQRSRFLSDNRVLVISGSNYKHIDFFTANYIEKWYILYFQVLYIQYKTRLICVKLLYNFNWLIEPIHS